ncbi:MAG: GNAT family N-acetyltransferase [Cognatishimia sp.]
MRDVTLVECNPTDSEAIHCLKQYYAELEARFERGFDVSQSNDPEANAMIRPRGVFYVAMMEGAPVGCVGVKGTGREVAEIKRLWVSPKARGKGLARQLMAACDTAAVALGITTLRLDTNSALPEAAALYHTLGWHLIDRFNDDPYPDLFFEKALS